MQFKNIKLFTNKEIENITMFYNEQEIKVKRYLPINDKLDLISWVINQSADELKFYNVGKIIVFKAIGLVKYYTELEFTEEELNDVSNLYDKLYQSGFLEELLITIPEEELNFIDMVLDNTVDSIYKYQNSVMGILDTVTTDYKDLNFDVEQLQKNISNPENLTLLKDVVTKLG
jgi:uncharacterized protein YjgD (DUF1641 family)